MRIFLKTDSDPIKWRAALKSLEKYGYIWNGSKKNPLYRVSDPSPYLALWVKDKTITFWSGDVSEAKEIIEIVME